MSKDRFSHASDDYQRYRPRYSSSLFNEIAGLAGRHELAWDCGCGSGQASVALAQYFQRVLATDLSFAQVLEAPSHKGIHYAAARAEQPPLGAESVDLILVAQALHWFDFQTFFAEVERVLRHRGVFVAVTYNLLTVAPEIDALVHELYFDLLKGCWDAERRHVEEAYRNIPLPYEPIPGAGAGHSLQAQWSVDHLLGYLRTWSGVKQYQSRYAKDPVAFVEPALRAAWQDGERAVDWPLTALVRRKP